MRVFVVKPYQEAPIIIPNIAEVRLSGTGTYVNMYNARGKIVARLLTTKVKEYWIESDAS
jgi:hypothetical protein